MKQLNGIWLPDHEVHLMAYAAGGKFGKWTYQAHKLLAALEYLEGCRTALDIGGHCGLWSKELVKVFDHIHAFEPIAEHRECFLKNVEGKFTLHPVALGDRVGSVSLHTREGQSGDSWIDGEGDIPLTTLDSFDIKDVDFIKLDCEGYEYFALKGGEKLIKEYRPIIIVEQKPNHGEKFGISDTEAVEYLKTFGYKVMQEISGDYILCHQH